VTKERCLTTPAPINGSTAVDVQGNHVDLEEFVFVPRYNVSASAGYGAWNDDESPMFTEFSPLLGHKPSES
jgi:phage repressor protein C with HTH and peptisase S24 domain